MAARTTITKAANASVPSQVGKPTKATGRRQAFVTMAVAAAVMPLTSNAVAATAEPLEALWQEFQRAQAAFLMAYEAEDKSLAAVGESVAYLSSTPEVLKAHRWTNEAMRARAAVFKRIVATPPFTLRGAFIKLKAAHQIDRFDGAESDRMLSELMRQLEGVA